MSRPSSRPGRAACWGWSPKARPGHGRQDLAFEFAQRRQIARGHRVENSGEPLHAGLSLPPNRQSRLGKIAERDPSLDDALPDDMAQTSRLELGGQIHDGALGVGAGSPFRADPAEETPGAPRTQHTCSVLPGLERLRGKRTAEATDAQ